MPVAQTTKSASRVNDFQQTTVLGAFSMDDAASARRMRTASRQLKRHWH